jgi:hypothetical protein
MLTGDVLASELPSVITAVENVRGVTSVDNRLVVHLSADGIPALQGESPRPEWWSVWLRSGWSPAGILAAGGATAVAIAAMMTRR